MSSFQSVLRLLVSPQVHFPLEAFPAQVTAERFEARVFPAVRNQVGALAESLPANLALVRLLSCSGDTNDTRSHGGCFLRITHYSRRGLQTSNLIGLCGCAVPYLCG